MVRTPHLSCIRNWHANLFGRKIPLIFFKWHVSRNSLMSPHYWYNYTLHTKSVIPKPSPLTPRVVPKLAFGVPREICKAAISELENL